MQSVNDSLNGFSGDTKFYTSTGLRAFNEFQPGEELLVPTHLGNWKRATINYYGCLGVERFIIARGTVEKKTFLCTPFHKWILENGDTTREHLIGKELFHLIYKEPAQSLEVSCSAGKELSKLIGRNWTIQDIIEEDITVPIWCIDVQDDHSFILEGGIPTANCSIPYIRIVY